MDVQLEAKQQMDEARARRLAATSARTAAEMALSQAEAEPPSAAPGRSQTEVKAADAANKRREAAIASAQKKVAAAQSEWDKADAAYRSAYDDYRTEAARKPTVNPATAAKTPAQVADDDRADRSAAATAAERGRKQSLAGEIVYGGPGKNIPLGEYDANGTLRRYNAAERNAVLAEMRKGTVSRTGTREEPYTSYDVSEGAQGYTAGPARQDSVLVEEEEIVIPPGGLGGTGGLGGSGGGGSGARVGRDPDLAEGTRLDNEKKRRDLLGPATAALTNYISLIEAVEKQVASGEMKPEEAAEYAQISNNNYKAALKGSNLADEQERMRADKRAKNNLGKDLINQRVSSGSSLAAALTSAAFGSDIMMPQGKSSLGYSPTMLALETTKELGGGQQISDFAKSMLTAEEAPWL